MTISEEDFENLPDSSQNLGVAIEKKHAYKTVVIKPSNSNEVSNDSLNGGLNTEPSKTEASPSERVGIDRGSKSLDKINNLVQKEIALGRVGVTRDKAYRVIATALEAKKWTDVVDEQGNVKRELVDDLDKQRWGAEMAIKMFGDMIERKEIEHDLGDKTLDRLRALSVSELKARAADILLGKKVGTVVDAEVVR